MLAADARVETEQSRRYLAQLCGHLSKVGGMQSPMHVHVEWADNQGVISVRGGRCTLRALPNVLTLHAEAPDEDTLRQVKDRVAGRLKGIGKREHLKVNWTSSQAAGEQSADTIARHDGEGQEGQAHG